MKPVLALLLASLASTAAADKPAGASAAGVADKARNASSMSAAAVADSVITTKVKADLFKAPELKSMDIHVETDKGIVMLSGFVDTKADAERAAALARGVSGVSEVKSAIKVR